MIGKNKVFSNKFAPQEGLVNKYEKPLRDEICLNGYWEFMPTNLESGITQEEATPKEILSDYKFDNTYIKIPSPWNVNTFSNGKGGDFRSYPSYPEVWGEANSGWLKKKINIPSEWKDNRIVLHFEAVAGLAKIFVNGEAVAENFDSFLPFNVDITDYVSFGHEATILVWIADGKVFNKQTKYGEREFLAGSFWGSHIVGIWQDVYLQKLPNVFIKDTYIKPDLKNHVLGVEVTINNNSNKKVELELGGSINVWKNNVGSTILETPEIDYEITNKLIELNTKVEIDANLISTISIQIPVDNKLSKWSPNEPNLHVLLLDVFLDNNKIDTKYERFGWRTFEIRGKNLYLNGEPIQIKGDSWHFTGVPQMSRRYAYAWYQMLKDANANGVRLHAQVFPRFYLDMADEMGICILDETSIWWSDAKTNIESEKYWHACKMHVERMVLRDRNHPSVFGWSVCNETLEVAQRVFHAPKHIVRRNVEEINNWVKIVKKTDPTRSWISGDGEFYPFTNLPTRIMHYTIDIETFLISLLRKPWGVGETGMAYYGTPMQVSKINGDRAYESQLGRMEGLAGEAFDLIKVQRNCKAAYTSIFNLVWYSLKPLPFGLIDRSKAYTLNDGIFFNNYEEGIPGYQPERIGPYASTLNPGLDKDIPLYKPWPLFDAVKAAFSDDYKSIKNKWKIKKDTKIKASKHPLKDDVVWFSESKDHVNKSKFEDLGIVFKDLNNEVNQLIIIDGTNPPKDKNIIDEIKIGVKNGSNIIVWQATESAKDFIEIISDKSIEIYYRDATSYLVENPHAFTRNQSHASYYFSEQVEKPVSTHSIGGEWVDENSVILKACDTDWQKWNYQPEHVKTAMVYRSEKEFKNPGTVVAFQKFGDGEIIVSTLDLFSLSMDVTKKVSSIMRNLGAPITNNVKSQRKAIDRNFKLMNALLVTTKKDSKNNIVAKRRLSSNPMGYINIELPSTEDEDYYIKFSIYSSRSLTDLLVEPGTPRLDMNVKIQDDIEVLIGNLIVEKSNVKRIDDRYVISALPFEKGWNDVYIKLSSKNSKQKIKLWFSCSKKSYLKEMKSLVEK